MANNQFPSSFKQPQYQDQYEPNPARSRSMMRGALGRIITGIVILVIIFFLWRYLGSSSWGSSSIDPNSYYAVFLTNNQVYFGKITKNNSDEMDMSQVYYLQSSDNTSDISIDNNQTHFNLIKLGAEIHGPTNELFINKSQVLFYEKLRPDSNIVQSINNQK